MTIMSAAREVAAVENPTMDSLAKAISSGSLRGARGNSGVILSQLFRGFTKEIKGKETVDVKTLAQAFVHATETAYKAVMKPKEGTILTVAKGMADKAVEVAEETDDVLEFGGKVIEHGDYVLSQTPEMLPVLKQAGVVDSGGQGLMQGYQKQRARHPPTSILLISNMAIAPSLSSIWRSITMRTANMSSRLTWSLSVIPS